MPGFIDVHTHIAWGGQYLNGIGLRDATTMAEVLRRVKSYVAAHPGGGWIQGEAWSYGYPDLEGGEFHYVPSERITVPQANRAYTLDAAFASHREKQEGSLEVGKLADFVVLSNNLLEIKPQEIAKVTVLRTIVGGRQVYAAP
jgi:predicted amidohydrolase YtcJ